MSVASYVVRITKIGRWEVPEKAQVHKVQAGSERDSMQILVAEDSIETERSVASLFRKRWGFLPGVARSEPQLTLTYYYPYYFQSWKATIPKTMGRTMKVRLFTGVDGMSRAVGPATEWPVGKEVAVEAEEVIPAHTSEAEAERLSQDYVKRYVTRRYRASKPPIIDREEFATFYVPYYVYAREDQPLHKAVLIEGFTGARGRVKDVPAIREALTDGEAVARLGKGVM